MTEELKRCPFCDGEASVWEVRSLTRTILYEIICHQCQTHSKTYQNKADPIKAWNTRVTDEPIDTEQLAYDANKKFIWEGVKDE